MIIDLNCPIEMRGYQIIYDDIGSSIATITLFNLADETINAYSAVIHGEYLLDHTHFDASCDVDALDIEGGVTFKLQLPVDTPNADKLEIYFSKVVFADGTVWQGGKECDLVDVGELHPLAGDELDALKDVAGEDAVIYPEMQDNYWRCVCGRINRLEAENCWRCRRSRSYVLTELNAKILHLSEKELKARIKQQKRAKKKRAMAVNVSSNWAYIFFLITAIIIFFIVFAYIGFIRPKLGV